MKSIASVGAVARETGREPSREPSHEPLHGTVGDLVRLLHRDASADDIARCLSVVEQLPRPAEEKAALAQLVRMAMDVRLRLDLQQQRERGLLAVIESAQDLSSRLDLTGVLSAIVSRARNLLGSDVSWLSVHDPERGEFRVLVADGVLAQSTREMVTQREQGVASIVMSTRLPFITTDYLNDREFAHDARLDATFRAEGIAALVGVPLLWEGDVVGLLFVADRYHRTHTAQSIAILCALATHGAVALRNARDFEGANAALEKADQTRDELERHVRSVQAATDAHERLTSLLARGASLSTLCQTVAQLLDGSVLVLDEASQVVSRGIAEDYANPGAQTYSLQGERGSEIASALRLSRQRGRSVVAYEVDGETCRVMPVIGGADVLGSVVLFHRGELSEISVRTFERSSSIVGIVLLSQERMESARSGSVSALLQSLVSLRQADPAELADRAGRHGLELNAPLTLTMIEMDGPSASFAARRFRTLPAFTQTLVDEIDGYLVILCEAARAADVCRAFATSARADLGATFRGVQSRPVAGPAAIPELFATLKRALTVLGRLGVRCHIVGQNELALYSTLFETHDQASLVQFLEATIGPLLAYDRKRNTRLTHTLLSYLENQQNSKTTAQDLHIHANTVRQRLVTIETLIGAWSTAARALEFHVALRLWSLQDPGFATDR